MNTPLRLVARRLPWAWMTCEELLDKHVIPAAWLPEPFGTEAQQEYGAVQLADFDQGSLQNFPIGTIAGNASWVQAHPNTVAAFLRAYAVTPDRPTGQPAGSSARP